MHITTSLKLKSPVQRKDYKVLTGPARLYPSPPDIHEIQALEGRGPWFVHTKASPWLRLSSDI